MGIKTFGFSNQFEIYYFIKFHQTSMNNLTQLLNRSDFLCRYFQWSQSMRKGLSKVVKSMKVNLVNKSLKDGEKLLFKTQLKDMKSNLKMNQICLRIGLKVSLINPKIG